MESVLYLAALLPFLATCLGVHTDEYEVDVIKWGMVEQGVIERKKYTYTPVVEPTEPEEPTEIEELTEPTEPENDVDPENP